MRRPEINFFAILLFDQMHDMYLTFATISHGRWMMRRAKYFFAIRLQNRPHRGSDQMHYTYSTFATSNHGRGLRLCKNRMLYFRRPDGVSTQRDNVRRPCDQRFPVLSLVGVREWWGGGGCSLILLLFNSQFEHSTSWQES